MKSNEHEQQSAFFDWVDIMKLKDKRLELCFAVPNAGKRSYGAAMYMKAEGLRAGVPDVWLPVPNKKYCGLVMENKYGGNKLTDNQELWLRKLKRVGHYVCVCRSTEQMIKEVSKYLGIK